MPYLKTAAYSEPEKLKSYSKFRVGLYFFCGIVIVGAAFGLFYYKNQTLKSESLYVGMKESHENEKNILVFIARHIVLPAREEPIIGTIEQPESLKKEQPFFQDVERGDVVVLYQQTGRAIIYRPSRDILVNVGFLVISGGKQTKVMVLAEKTMPATTNTVMPNTTTSVYINDPLKIEIRNGSKTAGAAARVGKALSQDKTAYIVTSVAPASRKDYAGLHLVSSFKISPSRLGDLQKRVGPFSVSQQLPPGEYASHADALLIIGN